MSDQLAALVPIAQPEYQGGLVVVAYPHILGEEISIYAEWPMVLTSTGMFVTPSATKYAIVNEYVVGGRLIYAALFHHLRPETYKVYYPQGVMHEGAYKNVTIVEGVVVQVTFVYPNTADRPELEDYVSVAPRHRRNAINDSRRR